MTDQFDPPEEYEYADEMERSFEARDDRLQLGATIKEELAELYNRLSELALLFTDDYDAGALASQMVTSTQEIHTWANVYATFGPDAIEPTDPLSGTWWRAILKTDDPAHWLKEARDQQLGAAQIRAKAGVKQERKPPFLDIGATMKKAGSQNLLFSPDCELPEDTPDECRAELRVRIKDE
jgi:hypothetical protein